MRSIPNVIRRGNVLHFRRAVPVELRAHLRRGELTRSLQTDSFKAAKVRSRALYIASEHLFDRVRVTPMLSDDQLAGLVQDFYATVIEQENAVRLNGDAFSEEMRQARIGYYAGVAATAKESLARNELAHGSFVAEAMLQKHRLSEKLTSAERNQVRQAMLRAGIDLAEHIKARYEGDFNHEPRDKLLKAKIEKLVDIPATTSKLDLPAKPEGPKLSAVAQKFCADQVTTKAWERQTANQASKSFALFIEANGDLPIETYTRAHAAHFKDVTQRLPATSDRPARKIGGKDTKPAAASRRVDVIT